MEARNHLGTGAKILNNIQGSLNNGQCDLICRNLLYSDDFNPRKQLFLCGPLRCCYMFLLALAYSLRKGQSYVCAIPLDPVGVAANYVLNSEIQDAIQGSVEAFENYDSTGVSCRQFLHFFVFIRDCPASLQVTDITGHNVCAPCTHYTFKQKIPQLILDMVTTNWVTIRIALTPGAWRN